MVCCSVFGHRNSKLSNSQLEKLNETIDYLVREKGVTCFLFGSKSKFNDICLSAVSNYKQNYPEIKRIGYPCLSEKFFLEKDRDYWQNVYINLLHRDDIVLCVDEIKYFKNRNVAGASSYVQRNYAMIDDCEYCLFFFNDKIEKGDFSDNVFYNPKSGTALAYNYAKRKVKTIINIFD